MDLADTSLRHPIFSLAIVALLLLALLLAWFFLLRSKPPAPEELEAENREIKNLKKADYKTNQSQYLYNLAKLEKGGALVIDLIHDQGYFLPRIEPHEPVAKPMLDFDEALEAAAAIRRMNKASPLVFVLHTPGGIARAAHIIADAILDHNERCTLKPGQRSIVYVPYHAYSAGTLISLAADKIVMGKRAELGPVDLISGGLQREDLAGLLDEKDRNFVQDEYILMKFNADKAWAWAEEHARRIVNEKHVPPSGGPASEIADKLMKPGRSHSHGVRFDEAKALGLNVDNDCPPEVFELVDARLRMIAKGQPASDFHFGSGLASEHKHMQDAHKFYMRRRLE